MKKIFALISSLFLAGVSNTFAVTWTEVGNAGRTVATAQDTTGAGVLSEIYGTYNPYSDVDFYNISTAGGLFSATMDSPSTDPMLFLWDSAGNPILFNDDWFGLQSYITGVLAAGNYILGIATYANGYGFHHADTDFGGSEGGSDFYGYTVHLEGAQTSGVPDSGTTVALLGLAMGGMAWVSRKNKRKNA